MDLYLKKLEFDKILNILIKYCVTQKGKELAKNLIPSNNYDEVQKNLAETKEAVSLMYRNSYPNFYEFQDISLSIKNLESGISLSSTAILNLNKIFKIAYELKNYINKDFLEQSDYPILFGLFEMLYTNKGIIDEINLCLSDDGIIQDNASNDLKNIRKTIDTISIL